MKKNVMQVLVGLMALCFIATSSVEGQWAPMGNYPEAGVFLGTIQCFTKDKSGNLYAAGNFGDAYGYRYVAKWDGSNWSVVGGAYDTTFNGKINFLTTDLSGNLYAAGEFTNSNGKRYVAKWNGSSWSELGGTNNSTFNGWIITLTTDASGNVYAAGHFKNLNGKWYVAKWNGIAWSEVGGTSASTFNKEINSLVTDANGNLYAAGRFDNGQLEYVAKWDGSKWSELGGTNTSSFYGGYYGITNLLTDTSGNLYAAGDFVNSKGKKYVAKWNGSIWSEIGGKNTSTFNDVIWSITTDMNGNMYAAGWFKNDIGKYYVAKWDGSGWSELGGTNASTFNFWIWSLTTDTSGNLLAAGDFSGHYNNSYVAKWNGSNWSELGVVNFSIFNRQINSLVADASGNLYAAGAFVNGNKSWCPYVAKWNGINWIELGGVNTSNFAFSDIKTLLTDASGNVYAAGDFVNSYGYQYIAKWNGSNWSAVGGNYIAIFNSSIKSLITDAGGKLYAAGRFSNGSSSWEGSKFVAKWDGSNWKEVGGANVSTFNNAINKITIDAIGNLYAAGLFTDSLNWYDGKQYVAKFNGSIWSKLGGGTNFSSFNGEIKSLVTDAIGNVYAAGLFTNGNGKRYIAKWNGNVWSEVGGMNTSTFDSTINYITIDASGNLFAAGYFRNGMGKQYVAKWNGSAWSEVGGTNTSLFNSGISSLLLDASGNIYSAGNFTLPTAGYLTSYVAKFGSVTTPLTLTSFTAQATPSSSEVVHVALNWQTATEVNTSHFIVEQSSDGKTFSAKGTVNAFGSGANDYQFTDKNPNKGVNYYRLKMVDKDGSFTNSKVVSVILPSTYNLQPITLSPNPANEAVTVKISSYKKEKAVLQIVNAVGQAVKQLSIALQMGENKTTVPISNLANGSYTLQVKTESNSWQGRFVKE